MAATTTALRAHHIDDWAAAVGLTIELPGTHLQWVPGPFNEQLAAIDLPDGITLADLSDRVRTLNLPAQADKLLQWDPADIRSGA